MKNKTRRVTTSKLNDVMLPEIEKYPPQHGKENILKSNMSPNFLPKTLFSRSFVTLLSISSLLIRDTLKIDFVKTLISKEFR